MYICGAPGVITNNVTYVHLTQIFGDNFDANLLMDGVHPFKDANHLTAEFIINLLSENLKPTTSQHGLLGAPCFAWCTSA